MAEGTTATEVTQQATTRAAYERLLPRIMAVEGSTHINVDVMSAALLPRAKLKAIQAMEPLLVEKLKDFDPIMINDLEPLSRALQHAHGLYLQATKAPAALQHLFDEATLVRDLLHGEAQTMSRRGLINADAYREVKRSNAHRALILDLQILVQTFRERWEQIAPRTGIKPEELDNAEALVDTLTEAVIVKDYSPAAQAQATRIREKAFLLLARTYGEVRDAILYVRRNEGDGDTIAPSLYGNRNGKKSQSSDKEDEQTEETGSEVDAKDDGDKEKSPENTTPPSSETLIDHVTEHGPFKRASGEA